MIAPSIEIRDLSYQYPDHTQALLHIDLKIEKGESVAIIGKNGAGKSTLLLHLNGSLVPATGEVLIGEHRVCRKSLNLIRQRVGVVFQDPDDQLFMPTVYDDVAFGPLNLGLSNEEIKNRVEQALNIVGLLGLKDRPPYHLSGGEKKRIAIASVLSMRPEILVLDEPVANLDPGGRRDLINLLNQLEQTKVIATHDLDMALDICRRTVIIHEGQIIADGDTEQYMRDEKILRNCSLELPLRLQACPVCRARR